jgi:hypothetical protein
LHRTIHAQPALPLCAGRILAELLVPIVPGNVHLNASAVNPNLQGKGRAAIQRLAPGVRVHDRPPDPPISSRNDQPMDGGEVCREPVD